MGKKSYHLPENYKLQDYTITKVLGEGGFGIVYHAKDSKLNRELAIKEYYPHISVSRDEGYTVEAKSNYEENYQEGLGKFIAEARVLASCEHPHIVKVYSIIEANNTAYMVMPYYQGITLDKYIKKNGRLNEEVAYHYLKPICEALAYLHKKDYIHRDIKPSNIFLRQRGDVLEPVLLDFGGARQFNAEVSGLYSQILTEGYAPPEQYRKQGKQAGYTDIYALAATFYHMASGALPLAALDRELYQRQMANQVLSDEASPDLQLESFQPEVARVLDKALRLEPNERYQNIASFVTAFEQALYPNATELVTDREESFRARLAEEQIKRAEAEQRAKEALGKAEPVTKKGNGPFERFMWVLVLLALVFGVGIMRSNWMGKLKELSNEFDQKSAELEQIKSSAGGVVGFDRKLKEAEEVTAKLIEERDSLQTQLDIEKGKDQNTNGKIDELEESLSSVQTELSQKEAEIESLSKDLEKASSELEISNAEIGRQEAELSKLQADLELTTQELKAKSEELEVEKKRLQTELGGAGDRVVESDKKLKEVEKAVSQLTEERDSLLIALDAEKLKSKANDIKVSELEEQLDSVQEEFSQQKSELEGLSKDLTKANNALELSVKEVSQQETELSKLRDDLEVKTRELNKKTEEFEVEKSKLQAELAALTSSIGDREEDLASQKEKELALEAGEKKLAREQELLKEKRVSPSNKRRGNS